MTTAAHAERNESLALERLDIMPHTLIQGEYLFLREY